MKKSFWLFSLLVLTCLMAQAQIVRPVEWQSSVQMCSADEAEVQITAIIQENWILSAVDRSDGFMIPLEITFTPSDNYQLQGKMRPPKAQQEYDDIFGCTDYFYKDKAVFIQRIKIKTDKGFVISCHVTGQSCTGGRCIQVDEMLDIKVEGLCQQEKETVLNDSCMLTNIQDTGDVEKQEELPLQHKGEGKSFPMIIWLLLLILLVVVVGVVLFFVFRKKSSHKRKVSPVVPQGKGVANGYELIRLLGKGGMAEVWYAENKIHKPAAVKILLPQFCEDSDVTDRFRKEADMMVRLNHPNIRQVYDYDEVEGRPCIVMEYLEGEDLSTRLKKGERFTQSQLRQWWNQLVSALNYTHAQDIVHRDIKPSNIVIDQEGNVKLLDFGIAKMNDGGGKTQTGTTMGTLMYMSPEQVMDAKHLDYKTDLYSLAVTFVQLLTGRVPYDMTTTSDYQVRRNIVEVPLDTEKLPLEWKRLLEPYLEKNPEMRPSLKKFDTVDDAENTVMGAPAGRSFSASDENTIMGRPSPSQPEK